MIRSVLTPILAAMLLAAGPLPVGPAHAQSCFSVDEARTAASGIVPLSSVINQIRAATGGEILFRVNGKAVDLAAASERELKSLRPHMQMIFQDPFSSLNPRMTVGAIVGEPLVVNDILTTLRLVPGLRFTGDEVTSPVGDVVATPLQVIRTTLGLVTAVGAQTDTPVITGSNPDSFIIAGG